MNWKKSLRQANMIRLLVLSTESQETGHTSKTMVPAINVSVMALQTDQNYWQS